MKTYDDVQTCPGHDPRCFIDLFLFETAVVRDKAVNRQIVNHIDFCLTCDVNGDPDVNNITFPSIIFQILYVL